MSRYNSLTLVSGRSIETPEPERASEQLVTNRNNGGGKVVVYNP